MAAADPGTMLDAATTRIVAAGPPGVHLSVETPLGRLDSCRGLAQAFGDGGAPLERPLSIDTSHDLGSVTKIAGTTTMLAALVSAGRLELDAPVRRLLPDFPAEVTLPDLLTHRAGLWEWWPTYLQSAGADAADADVADADAALAQVFSLPLRYPPRTGRHYSDLGFMTLGRVVETVAGQGLPAALADLVTGPLGLPGMRYGGPPAGTEVAASSAGDRIEQRMVATGEPYPVGLDGSRFTGWRRQVLVGEVNDGNAFHSFGGAAGHAGLFAGAADLHGLGRALLDSAAGRGPWPALPRFLSPGPDAGQLLGFRSWTVTDDSCTAELIGHTGFPGVGFAVLPAHGATIVLLTNRLHVTGEPAPFEPLWRTAMSAAHAALHTGALG